MHNVAIDANLLLLYVVGSASRGYLAKHKRLKAYGVAEFDLLNEILANASAVVITPNVATEASNLAAYGVSGQMHLDIFAAYRNLIPEMVEHYESSEKSARHAEFTRLGLADCAWFGVLDQEDILLTDDLPFYLAALNRGLNASNFTHLRQDRGLL